jgi:UDP-GlcNAc:undecaprenyl-phosphate GlcNAc-1-phosphate transferase
VLLTIGILIGIEIFVEAIGLVGENRTPMLNWIRKLVRSNTSKVDSNEFKEENTLKDKVRTRSERHKK